ncbi:DsrE family protein [Spirosoma profusum]|nr:DsrE family protein [Spirosoma profusum]
MIRIKQMLLASFLLLAGTISHAQSTQKKMKFLIHVTCGPDNPTKAALAFLVAKTATDEGHTVALFLAGDAVTLLKDSELDKVVGLGTGKLRDHYDAIVKAGGKFYLSGMSSKARGLSDAEIAGKPAEFAMPTVLVRLATDSDKMFTY